MQQGSVKWFNESKGYGFIESEGQDFFCHFRQIKQEGFKTLSEGHKVTFTASKGAKGMEAHDVLVVGNA